MSIDTASARSGPSVPGVRQDLFPARITVGEETYPRGRVLVDTRGRAVIWVEDSGTVRKVADAEVASIERTRRRTFRITTADGDEWEATKSGSCGCGSPLRRLSRSKAWQ